ncbi:hypothetical protein CF336_g9346 [Tilletia laevis]|nr:hypothetical protein CF336_g9346 [Tilletia laevis]
MAGQGNQLVVHNLVCDYSALSRPHRFNIALEGHICDIVFFLIQDWRKVTVVCEGLFGIGIKVRWLHQHGTFSLIGKIPSTTSNSLPKCRYAAKQTNLHRPQDQSAIRAHTKRVRADCYEALSKVETLANLGAVPFRHVRMKHVDHVIEAGSLAPFADLGQQAENV